MKVLLGILFCISIYSRAYEYPARFILDQAAQATPKIQNVEMDLEITEVSSQTRWFEKAQWDTQGQMKRYVLDEKKQTVVFESQDILRPQSFLFLFYQGLRKQKMEVSPQASVGLKRVLGQPAHVIADGRLQLFFGKDDFQFLGLEKDGVRAVEAENIFQVSEKDELRFRVRLLSTKVNSKLFSPSHFASGVDSLPDSDWKASLKNWVSLVR